MQAMAKTFSDPKLYENAQRLARVGQWPFARGGKITSLPGVSPAGRPSGT
jgi:L-lactate dehydrogenase complex protein LldF